MHFGIEFNEVFLQVQLLDDVWNLPPLAMLGTLPIKLGTTVGNQLSILLEHGIKWVWLMLSLLYGAHFPYESCQSESGGTIWLHDKGQIYAMIRMIQPPNVSLEINTELIFRSENGQRKMFSSHLLIFWFLFFLNNTFSFLSSSEWAFCVCWGEGGVVERKRKHSKLCKAFLPLCHGLPPPWKAPGIFCLPVMILIMSRRTRGGIPGSRLRVWISTSVLSSGLDAVIYFWQCELSTSCGVQRLPSSFGMQASHCTDFSLCGEWALGHSGFSSWGAWTQ